MSSSAPKLRAGPAMNPARIGALLVLAALMMKMVVTAARPLTDPDIWWHLRLGHDLRGGWAIANPGQLSTFATSDWVPTQWLPDLVASVFEDWFGLGGVAWLFGAGLISVVITVFYSCRLLGDLLPATLATVLATVGASGSLSSRPQLLSFALLAVTLIGWLSTEQDLRPRWWLIPLAWVWASTHGFWFVGVLVGSLFAVGLVLDRRVAISGAWRYAAIPVASLIAASLTPVGPKLLLAPFDVNERAAFITEWQPTTFRQGSAIAVAAMIVVVVVLWARRGGTSWTHLALLLMAAGWVVLSIRTVAIGAVLASPLVAAALQQMLPSQRPPASRGEHLSLGGLGFVSVTAVALLVPFTSGIPGAVPRDIGVTLAGLPAGTTVLNEYRLGGWIEWSNPHLNPVIDGLADAYPVAHLRRYTSASVLEPGWRRFVTESGAEVAVLTKGGRLARGLRADLGWTLADVDAGYVLLEAPQQTPGQELDPGVSAPQSDPK